MAASDKRKWPPFTSHMGKRRTLNHVHPFATEITHAGVPGKPERKYACWVTFRSHCFTHKRPIVELKSSPRIYRDYLGENRTFCEERYALSLGLKEILVKNFANQTKCSQMGDESFLLVEIIDRDGNKIYYEIYFKIFKATRRNTINIDVTSAYPRNLDSNKRPIAFSTMRISTMAFNVINNKPLKKARERSRKR